MKVLFLDFDGVINYHSWFTPPDYQPYSRDFTGACSQFDPACVSRAF